MRRVVLHVGMHKTGTSSIQASLHDARAALAGQGIIYAPLGRNHSVPIYDAFSKDDFVHRRHRLRRTTDRVAISDAGKAHRLHLRASILEHRTSDFVISGEGIPRLSHMGTHRMVAFLRKFFQRIEVVIFVRPPASFLHSQVQQQIKAGMTLERLASAKFRINYQEFEKYFDILPRDAIRTQVYAPDSLVEGCAVKTFCAVAGLPEVPVLRANDGLSRPAADFLLVANEILPVFGPDGLANPARSRYLVRTRFPGPKFYAARDIVLRGLESSRDDIAWTNQVLGLDLAAHDDGLAARDCHPGVITAEARAEIAAQVLAENARLLEERPGKRDKPERERRRAERSASQDG